MMTTTATVEANVKSISSSNIVIEINIPLMRSMPTGEDIIQLGLNAAGELATAELLKVFDTDGSPIEIGNLRFTSKGEVLKEYETPYGKVGVNRHVYQSGSGGNTFCPMDKDARIIGSATPKLAKMISNKYSRSSVDEVKDDFKSNHGRGLSRRHIQNIADKVGGIAIIKEESWSYPVILESDVATISIGMDGAMMLMRDDGYREAMSGTIAFYNKDGDRLHTNYIAATPEYGKAKFFARMSKEIKDVKSIYPKAEYIGIADGASTNWSFLESHTTKQITDFYHASEYLTKASHAIFKNTQEKDRINWLEAHCHQLKHDENAVVDQLKELKKLQDNQILSAANSEKLDTVITYFTNQGPRMQYNQYRKENLPIGSGVTEAACKTTIKQRLCRSGMRWKDRGAAIVLALKCLDKSKRWEQFWNKINQYGVPVCA
jgi:hypothetical protein